MTKTTPQVGDIIPTWFGQGGMSKVLNVFPYTGRYTDSFSHVLVLTAPRTKKGFMEMVW